MNAVLLSSYYAVMLTFLCLNHMLQEPDCVLKLKTPVVFPLSVHWLRCFPVCCSILDSFSSALPLGRGAINQRRCAETSTLSPDFRSPHLRLGLLLLLHSRSISHIGAWTVVGSCGMPASWCPLQLNNCLLDRINLKTVVNTPSVTEYMQMLDYH